MLTEHYLMLIQRQKNAKVKLEITGRILQITGEKNNKNIPGLEV